ncbi:MAG: replication-relaxation family protein, partial [Solirubrobacterales bacterium]
GGLGGFTFGLGRGAGGGAGGRAGGAPAPPHGGGVEHRGREADGHGRDDREGIAVGEEQVHSQRGGSDRGDHWPLPPETAAESYAELVDLDAAHRVRWARPPASPRTLDPDPLDLEILALIASMRHVLTSQIHRRFNSRRALTTTQRRLKSLSDAGLVERFQFHRRDGGGAPMCYAIAPRGLDLLRADERLDALAQREIHELRDPSPKSSHPNAPSARSPRSSSPPAAGDRLLRQARHDVHVTGWALALERALGGTLRLRGPEESVLSPPLRSTSASDRRSASVAIGPGDLRLPGGRTPHDFLRTDPAGARVEVERFETVRPDASVEVGAAGACLLIELDDRLSTRSHLSAAAKLERYDHLLSGWAACTPRFARRGAASPLVVFLCRDRPRARECARGADHLLSACRAYAGEHPHDWEYPGRAAIAFASERDVHEGVLLAYGVPRLPPEVRAAGEDPGAREAACEPRALLPR